MHLRTNRGGTLGTWEFPGGTVEFGETLAQAIHREVLEEFGIQIKIQTSLGAFDHILPKENDHWVSTTFITTLLSGTPTILEPEKCEAIGWFELEALPTPLSVITEDNLRAYRNFKLRPIFQKP